MGDEHDPPRDRDDGEGEKTEEKRRLFERVIPELVKGLVERAVERGVEKLQEGPENLRHLVGEMKLPKEVLHYLYTQIDETKNGVYRVIAKEVRDVLEQTKFADEITKVLTKLSFEIKTEIRFVPNDAARSTVPPPGRRTERPDEPEGDDEPGDEGEDAAAETATRLPKPQVKASVTMRPAPPTYARDSKDRGDLGDRSREAGRGRRREGV